MTLLGADRSERIKPLKVTIYDLLALDVQGIRFEIEQLSPENQEKLKRILMNGLERVQEKVRS